MVDKPRTGNSMSEKQSPQSVIDAFQKRQKMLPLIIGGLAVLLVIIGIIILVVWFTGPNAPVLFPTATATATLTFTPTATQPSPTPTLTPTITETPTLAATQTPTGPYEYVVQSGDNCWSIAAAHDADFATLLALNNFTNGTCPITPGGTILIPPPGMQLPTPTEIPTNMAIGTRINYTVQSGDSLSIIASKFNTTIAYILVDNPGKITNQNNLNVGMVLVIRVNMVTPTPTKAHTSTPAGFVQGPTHTPTSKPSATVTPTP
jgi:LysM repeat protein